MELERRSIERADFSQARKGYDPGQVDRHLADIAAAVEELKRRQESERSASTMAGTAADRVRSIVDAAEQSASTIETEARAEADRVAEEARGHADQTRAQAEVAAADHLAKVKAASERMLSHADAVESEMNGLVDELRRTIATAVEGVRANAKSMGSELDGMRADLTQAREAAPAPLLEEEPPAATQAEPAEEAEPEPERIAEAPQTTSAQEAVKNGDTTAAPPLPAGDAKDGVEGARLVALNMALNGTPRDETARYLEQNFKLEDRDRVLDEAYARVRR